MYSPPRIGVFVEVRAVEISQPVPVGGEVRGHPVENHADIVLVQVVDQEHQVLRRPVAAGGGEVAGGLIAPGAVEGMLHQRQELHVGEAAVRDVLGQFRARSLDRSRSGLPNRGTASRSPGGPRRWPCGASNACRPPPLRHPAVVLPVVVQVPDDRRRPRRQLGAEGEGIGLVDLVAVVSGNDVVLVSRADRRHRAATLPRCPNAVVLQRMAGFRPAVEIAHHRHPLGVGGPNGKIGGRRAYPLPCGMRPSFS